MEKKDLDMQNDYKNQGFYLAKNLLKKKEIKEVKNDISKVFGLYLQKKKVSDQDLFYLYKNDKEGYLCCAKQAHNLLSLHRLASHNSITNMLPDFGISMPSHATKPVILFSSKFLADNHHFYWKAKPHQDWAGLKGSLDSVVAWMPLVPFCKELGYLEIVKGSHLKGLRKHIPSGPTVEIEEKLKCKFHSIPMQLGDVLFFSTLLIHRSGVNRSKSIRWSANFRYDNVEEKNFIARKFPNSFAYNRVQTQDLIPEFPRLKDIENIFT